MSKLSVSSVQQRLIEAEEVKKASYASAKKPTVKAGTFKAGEPSMKFISVKQIDANGLQKVTDAKGKPFVNQSERADKISDSIKTPTIFGGTMKTEGNPAAPSVERTKPNQTTKQSEVHPNMTKEGRKSPQYFANAPRADEIVDALPRGKIYSEGDSVPTLKAPTPKNLGATTRPKAHEVKKPQMGNDPTMQPKANPMSFSKQGMPSDAPKKPSWGKVNSGVVVRVNERQKAAFDVVSGEVLTKLVEQYKQFGYKVEVETTGEAKWKKDSKFLALVSESINAKMNLVPKFHRSLREAAFKRFYALTKEDYTGLYETRDNFLSVLREAFLKIEGITESKLRSQFTVFHSKSRINRDGKLHEIESIIEASDEQMALRVLRNGLMENFGLNTEIIHMFIDGKKYTKNQIKEWTPLA